MHFLFDANLSHRLAEALKVLEEGDDRGISVTISHADNLLGRGATDMEVIQEAGKTKAIIISQDDDFKRIKSNATLMRQLQVGYVLYKPPKKGSRYWDIVVSFVQGWQRLKETLANRETPFVFTINAKGESQEVFL
ncbi:MAG: DUF5615 family PIN-like protein [Chitinophagaceae bacterium]